MSTAESLYEWTMRGAARTLPALGFVLPEKVRTGLEGRVGLLDRIKGWAAVRPPGPVVWVHAPSVGEGLQTKPVIEALRRSRADLQVFYTFFSPSAERLADRMPVDFADYLPLDVARDAGAALDAVRPNVLTFGKTDVWPVLTREAEARGVALTLVSATLAPDSSRLRGPARSVLAAAYARLDAVGAISEEDARRFPRLGVSPDRIQVTGDARFDQVWGRAQAIDRARPPLSLLAAGDRPMLVAGSTWPEDEARLLPAVARLEERHPRLRVVLAPHEPTSDRLAGLVAEFGRLGRSVGRLAEIEAREARADTDIVLVDRVGVLAELYAAADIAYVGGGFGRRGLHSVLEPAALAVPTVIGPRHRNAREASELLECGGLVVAVDETMLERELGRWLGDAAARRAAGDAAAGYVRRNLGAARRNARLVLDFLGD